MMSISQYFQPKTSKSVNSNEGGTWKRKRDNDAVVILIPSDTDDDDGINNDGSAGSSRTFDHHDVHQFIESKPTISNEDNCGVEIVEESNSYVQNEADVTNRCITHNVSSNHHNHEQVESEHAVITSSNPFAQWAHGNNISADTTSSLYPSNSRRRRGWIPPAVELQSQPTSRKAITSTSSKSNKALIPMKDLSEREQQKEIEKWHSLVELFQNSPTTNDTLSVATTTSTTTSTSVDMIEHQRYHMVIAALLHARCQEPSVRVAIQKLTAAWDTTITVETMAAGDPNTIPENIQPYLTNLQYHTTKAKYILETSRYILQHCHGIVPDDVVSLLRLPGIGPVFADLLSFVNTRAIHQQQHNPSM
jgi:endonuclease III